MSQGAFVDPGAGTRQVSDSIGFVGRGLRPTASEWRTPAQLLLDYMSMRKPDSYYFSHDGIQRLGPFPLRQIKDMVNRGELRPEVLIRSEVDTNWTPLRIERQRLHRAFSVSFASALMGGIAKITASLYQKLVHF